jgi:ketosteroid isomerase-like protein
VSLAAETAVRDFIACINAHDAHGIVALCTRDHCFIDSLGARLSGLAEVEAAWRGYFALFPDYRIQVDAVISAGELVLSSGWASATLRGSGPSWRLPAAWRATVAGDRIAEWQVYADNKPVYEMLQQFPG